MIRKQKTLHARYPRPEDAARHLVQAKGLNGAARYARDRESMWSPRSEWWHRVADAVYRVTAPKREGA